MVARNIYQNLGSMWEGFTKWIYSICILSPAALILILIIAYTFFLSPFIVQWYGQFITTNPVPNWRRRLLAMQVVLILLMRILVDHNFKISVVSSLLHPLGFSYLILVAVSAVFQQTIGRGIKWKNRLYSSKSSAT